MLGKLITGFRLAPYCAARNAMGQSQFLTQRKVVEVPKRNWAQVGHVICTPPRVRVSLLEKFLHCSVMFAVWLTPIMWFLSQIKVWRRKYISDS